MRWLSASGRAFKATLCILAIAAGMWSFTAWARQREKVEKRQARVETRVANALEELAGDKGMRIQAQDIAQFIGMNKGALLDEYADCSSREKQGELRLAQFIANHYKIDELESLAPFDLHSCELFMFVAPEYDGKPRPIPVDGGEWEAFFDRSACGLGAEARFKSYVQDLYAQSLRRSGN